MRSAARALLLLLAGALTGASPPVKFNAVVFGEVAAQRGVHDQEVMTTLRS